MTGASFQFLGFAFAVVLVFNLFRSSLWHHAVLLAASLYFVALCSSGQSTLPFAAFVLFGYAGLRILQSGKTGAFVPLLVGTIAMFMWLKKYALVPAAVFLPFPYFVVGLSYILFRVLHLIIDARDRALPAGIGIVSYLNYTLNFTTLVSGPIQRYQQFDKTYHAGPRPVLTVIQTGAALERIVLGFFKVNVLGLLLSMVHSWGLSGHAAGLPLATSCAMGIAAFAAYPLFLYSNFSGYIDIAIAIGWLLGFNLPENFNRPFSSDNFINFWSRWHITLSEWLKTYVYNTILIFCMRRYSSQGLEPYFAVGAFFITFFLVGVWHGQTANFLFFGVLQGLGVSLNKLYQIAMARRLGRQRYKSLGRNGIYIALSRGLTFTWFAFTLIWFWSDWRQIAELRAAFGFEVLLLVWCSIFVGSTAVLAFWEAARAALLGIHWRGVPVLLSRYSRTAWSTVLLLVSLVIATLLNQRAPDIVYKGF